MDADEWVDLWPRGSNRRQLLSTRGVGLSTACCHGEKITSKRNLDESPLSSIFFWVSRCLFDTAKKKVSSYVGCEQENGLLVVHFLKSLKDELSEYSRFHPETGKSSALSTWRAGIGISLHF